MKKYFSGAALIFSILFIVSYLVDLSGFPLPVTIISMFVLFVLLRAGIVKIEDLNPIGQFMIGLLAICLIPPSSGIIDSFSHIKPYFFSYIGALVISVFLTMGSTALVVSFLMRRFYND